MQAFPESCRLSITMIMTKSYISTIKVQYFLANPYCDDQDEKLIYHDISYISLLPGLFDW